MGNTLGECKYTISGDSEGHTEWVSCVRFSPSQSVPLIVSSGWDKLVKVWNLTNCKLRNDLVGHTGDLNTVCVSPDGSLAASGGKDNTAMLWDLNEGKRLYSLDAGEIINGLSSLPTVTGCAPPLTTPSRSGIWNPRLSSTLFAPTNPSTEVCLPAHPWPGRLM